MQRHERLDQLLPAARPGRQHEQERGEAGREGDDQGPSSSLRPAGEQAQGCEHQRIEGHAERAQQHAQSGEHGVVREMWRGHRQAQLGADAGYHLGDQRRGDAGDEDGMVALEVVGRFPAHLLDHEQDAGDRRVERRGDPGAGARRDQRHRFAFATAGATGHAERGGAAHVHGRTLPAEREAGTQRQSPSDELHRQDPPPAQRPDIQQRALDLLNAAAGGFGREPAHEPAGNGQCDGDENQGDPKPDGDGGVDLGQPWRRQPRGRANLSAHWRHRAVSGSRPPDRDRPLPGRRAPARIGRRESESRCRARQRSGPPAGPANRSWCRCRRRTRIRSLVPASSALLVQASACSDLASACPAAARTPNVNGSPEGPPFRPDGQTG